MKKQSIIHESFAFILQCLSVGHLVGTVLTFIWVLMVRHYEIKGYYIYSPYVYAISIAVTFIMALIFLTVIVCRGGKEGREHFRKSGSSLRGFHDKFFDFCFRVTLFVNPVTVIPATLWLMTRDKISCPRNTKYASW